MITANIYSLEKMPAHEEQAIRDGLDLIGQYTGRITAKNLIAKLPTKGGRVDTKKVGYKNLDIMRHLHIFVAPLWQPDAVRLHGSSLIGSGISWIDSLQSPSFKTTTTSHEVAHSLGYVLPGRNDNGSENDTHCKDSECLMYPDTGSSEIRETVSGFINPFIGTSDLLQGLANGLLEEVFPGNSPDDFCEPCVADIKGTIDTHIDLLQRSRLNLNRVDGKIRINR